MRKTLLIGVALAASCFPLCASDFRFCDMEGSVQKATLHSDSTDGVFELSVLVSSARPEKGARGDMGYSDCKEFIGQAIEIQLQIPARFGHPGPGDWVAFNYSAVDGFDADGEFSGQQVDVSFHDYRAAAQRAGR